MLKRYQIKRRGNAMKIEMNTMYKAKIENLAFGQIPTDRLIEVVSSGRICGILLEADIAARFDGVVEGTQGNAPDLIDDILGTIQAKTYHSTKYDGEYKSGPRKGMLKRLSKDIFTTKSGLWDSMKRRRALGEDVDGQIVEYFDKYDCFCYIDISKMPQLEYTFAIVSSDVPKEKHIDGNISLEDILENIEKTIEI
jgi:hypothetical protein